MSIVLNKANIDISKMNIRNQITADYRISDRTHETPIV